MRHFAARNARGNTANNYIVSNGAALELTDSVSQSIKNGTYTLNGTGISGNGALRSISGDHMIIASVAVASNLPSTPALLRHRRL